MTKLARCKAIIAWFEKNQPLPKSELHYQNPYELLVAVILSAQCTDKRVNLTTPAFFKQFPTPELLMMKQCICSSNLFRIPTTKQKI